ncbi:MAG: hypothetical protein ACP5FK_01630 [bacterium]
MKLSAILVAVLLVFAGLGCSADSDTSDNSDRNGDVPELVEDVQEVNPQELGEQIGEVYFNALEDVTILLAEYPEVDEVRSQVEHLKQENILVLVELGKIREELSDQDKAIVDMGIMSVLDSLNDVEWYQTYSDICSHYVSVDRDFYDLVVSFNIIGQYANFDLLKQQEPEEAERLGIQ